MTRVFVIAGTTTTARRIADLFDKDDRIEIVGARAFHPAIFAEMIFAEVIVAVNIPVDQLPSEGTIVYLTDILEPVHFNKQIKAWLPAEPSSGELLAAVLAASNELTVLTAEQARSLLPFADRPFPKRQVVEPLTNRELEVLRLLASGWGNKQIAGKLGISDHTAKFHVAQILAKLNAASRTEAVTIAIRSGLIPI